MDKMNDDNRLSNLQDDIVTIPLVIEWKITTNAICEVPWQKQAEIGRVP